MSGGPSSNEGRETIQLNVDPKPRTESQITTGKTTVGATDCWTRFTGRAASRWQQHRRFGVVGRLPESARRFSWRRWQQGRWATASVACAAGTELPGEDAQHQPVGNTMPKVELRTAILKSQEFIALPL
ncbi:MAG TPA: hypothetical protein VFG04_18410 [Planctomycetaceae bacterium]|nr:hypothetical protein [Planctomycetaceae bacterium]